MIVTRAIFDPAIYLYISLAKQASCGTSTMTLPHARDARALFVVAITIIMVVLLSRSVVQESHAISGTCMSYIYHH